MLGSIATCHYTLSVRRNRSRPIPLTHGTEGFVKKKEAAN
jgi:hypothetical protein